MGVPDTAIGTRQMTLTDNPTPALLELLGDLRGDAGWLGCAPRPSHLRTSVDLLVTAVTRGTKPTDALLSVRSDDIEGVKSSALASLHRKSMRELRAELGDPPRSLRPTACTR